jgi:7-cyano-7-deazaguanine synthase in queuosine biosynthesis
VYLATVSTDDEKPAEQHLVLYPGKNLLTGAKQFRREFDNVTTLEIDLLTVASSIFACDLAFKRGEREEISRQIELTIPVVNFRAFNAAREEIIFALSILSHDAWQINFVRATGIPEPNQLWENTRGSLLLFSGGLDSFSAAVNLGDQVEKIELVSHVTANPVVKRAQKQLFSYLQEEYPGKFHRVEFRVTGLRSGEYLFPSDAKREDSQRTRSFMFLTLAGLVARRRGIHEVVYIAENGQMAIDLPLTAARISAFSTYTAHPEFLAVMEGILSQVLAYGIAIENPYLYWTKAEVIRKVVEKHRRAVGDTISCWKSSRVRGELTHCGVCIPCLIRRIALEYNGLKLPEYRVDLFKEKVSLLPADDEGKRNLGELGEFIKIFETIGTQAELQMYYPDLVNTYFEAEEAADMYKRFAQEARVVFDRYPALKKFLE